MIGKYPSGCSYMCRCTLYLQGRHHKVVYVFFLFASLHIVHTVLVLDEVMPNIHVQGTISVSCNRTTINYEIDVAKSLLLMYPCACSWSYGIPMNYCNFSKSCSILPMARSRWCCISSWRCMSICEGDENTLRHPIR